MAVTKRVRFEVLRRDEHTCQYCGAEAPDVTLQIDHVIPVALGGDDKPGNLVTACKDCNSGKTSISPDAPLVQSLSAEAAAYALGMVDKMTRFRADIESIDEYDDEFRSHWDNWGSGDGDNRTGVPLPHDYRMSLFRWMRMGIPTSVFELAIPPAMMRTQVAREAKFSYMAGIVWNMVNEREIDYSVTDETAAVYTESEADEKSVNAYHAGWDSGVISGERKANIWTLEHDYLQHHIDHTEMETIPSPWNPSEMVLSGGVRRVA